MQLKNNINTEKKLIKEVAEQQSVERKQFEKKMTQEYKLKKERWKREMAVRIKWDTNPEYMTMYRLFIPVYFHILNAHNA